MFIWYLVKQSKQRPISAHEHKGSTELQSTHNPQRLSGSPTSSRM